MFTGPAQQVIGPMFAGYKPEDRGWILATAPSPKPTALVDLHGYRARDRRAGGRHGGRGYRFSRQMREITLGENPNVTIPLSVLWACRRQSTSPAWAVAASAGDQHRHCP